MSTIDDKRLIETIVSADGYYEDDPRVAMIVEYTNAYGKQTWGVTWTSESPSRQRRYLDETEYVRSPKVIWTAVTQ